MNLSKSNLSIFGGVAIVVIFFALWLIPLWQSNLYRAKFTPENIQELEQHERVQLEKAASDVENSARLTLAQIIGGLALLTGLYFTYLNVRAAQDNAKTAQDNLKVAQDNLQNTAAIAQENLKIAQNTLKITEQGRITERFSKAVEMLGNTEKLDVRLGGIYALESIARDSQVHHWTVMEFLTAYVRENAPYNSDEKDDSQRERETKPREDIQAVMTIIGRRRWRETETQNLNLQGVDLFGYNLKKAHLSKANLDYANLSEADLSEADLSEADLKEANLTEAKLEGARLIKTYLSGANLSMADLSSANMKGAFLFEANLDRTFLKHTKNLTLELIRDTKHSEDATLPSELLEQLQAKEAKETSGAGGDSSENRSGE